MEATPSPRILITGATGSIGTELSHHLSARGVYFRAMVRSLDNAQALLQMPHAEVVIGDFRNIPSLHAALHGIDRAFLLTNSSAEAEQMQSNFVEAAQQTKLQHLVKLSQWAADLHSPVRFLRYHAAVEQQIRESGISYTFLRPNLFMQGLLGFKETINKKGAFFAAVGEAPISVIDIRDIAAAAASSLLLPGHEGKIYNLTGPEALTHYQMATYLAEALKQPVQFVEVVPEAMQGALLSAGFPTWQAEGLIEDYAHYARNEAAEVTSDLENLIGQTPRRFTTFAHDYAPAFSGE